MLVKIGRKNVDVSSQDCASRPCFVLGVDKGTYTPGRGYTSYHRDGRGKLKPRPVCETRHHRGCPTNSVCERCRTSSPDEPGGTCRRHAFGSRSRHDPHVDCGGQMVAPEGSS